MRLAVIVSISTDMIDTDVSRPPSGRVQGILVEVGRTVALRRGSMLGTIVGVTVEPGVTAALETDSSPPSGTRARGGRQDQAATRVGLVLQESPLKPVRMTLARSERPL